MKRFASLICFFGLLGGSTAAFARHYRGIHPIRPRNVCHMVPMNMDNIGADPGAALTGVDRGTFNAILAAVQDVYGPIVNQHGGRLIVNPAWDVDDPNAFAERSNDGRDWTIQVNGGIARAERMTPDALMLVACHEMGHHLGGLPYKPSGWRASAEGESDYFASLKCMRLVAGRVSVGLRREAIPPVVYQNIQNRCRVLGANPQDEAICERTHLAAQHLGWTLTDLENSYRKDHGMAPVPDTDLLKPDHPQVAAQTIAADYPGNQCRVDTYAAGAVCPVSATSEIRVNDLATGACTRPVDAFTGSAATMVFAPGARPACWFKQM